MTVKLNRKATGVAFNKNHGHISRMSMSTAIILKLYIFRLYKVRPFFESNEMKNATYIKKVIC
jgi:hypothetical protein